MKFFDKMYVGFKRDRYVSSETPRVLGFAVPYGETKAEKNRMETVDGWRSKDIDPKIFDNVPTRGFKLLEVVSRYSTSNKLFRVQDPRGFELEISADNLLRLAIDGSIIRGEIVSECVWTSDGKIYLLPVDSEEYKREQERKNAPKLKAAPRQEGNYYVSVDNTVSIFRFEGRKWVTRASVSHVATKGTVDWDYTSKNRWNRGVIYTVSEFDTSIEVFMDPKPFHVYTEFSVRDDGEITRKETIIRRSPIQNLIAYDGDISQEMKDYSVDFIQYLKEDDHNQRYDPEASVHFVNFNYSDIHKGVFSSKEEALEFDYSVIKGRVKPDIRSRYSYSNELDVSRIQGVNTHRTYTYTDEIHLSGDFKQNVFIIDRRKEK